MFFFIIMSLIQAQHLRPNYNNNECGGPFCGMKEGFNLFRDLLLPFPIRNPPRNGDECPVISPVPYLDLFRYTNYPWYVQMIGRNNQRQKDLYCLTTTYQRRLDGLIDISYRGRINNINGTVIRSNSLCAKQLNPRIGGQLGIQSCYLFYLGFDNLAQPYWILDHDPYYNWIIIISGQPNIKTPNGRCSPNFRSPKGYIGSGIWLLTRNPVPFSGTIPHMLSRLRLKGISPLNLTPVHQRGCQYI